MILFLQILSAQATESADKEKNIQQETPSYYVQASGGISKVLATYEDYYKVGFTTDIYFSKSIAKNVSLGFNVGKASYNGMYFEQQAALGCGSEKTCTQGDINSYILQLGGTYRLFPSLSIDLLGGVQRFPLLMDEAYFDEKIVPTFGYSKIDLHEGFKPTLSANVNLFKKFHESTNRFGLSIGTTYTIDFSPVVNVGLVFTN